MESGNDDSSSTGHCLPVPESSDDFQSILTRLESAYLFEESKHSFQYTTAFSLKNSTLEEKYNACREKRRQQGYTDEELKETFGFLLFDDLYKAKSIGETGVLTGNGTCTTLGDPLKGVYLSMYSDCLDLNRWYHGKSGYIAILRLTPGKVKKISENYTQNLTDPTLGFDCHVSDQFSSVSSKTSSFLAFERTQYYLYEMLDSGSTATSPCLACPYGVVAFSYANTKETQKEKSKGKKVVCPYYPWMGMLQIGSENVNVGISSTAATLTRANMPPVIKAERAISMLNLKKLLPKSVFDTAHTGKGVQEDLECSVFEIFASSLKEKEKLSSVLQEIKEKDVALIKILNNGGYLVLIHESHFIFHDNDNGMTTNKVFQGVFVFPGTQAIQRVAKSVKKKQRLSSDALRALPLLTYAEGKIEKATLNPNEDRCETFTHYMQSYAALINPGPPSSPSREVSIFPDQYDVPNSHEHLYSSPEWTDKHCQSLKLYLNNANSFHLPVCKVSEIFVAGQEARREDTEDEIYICLSSPEEQSPRFIKTELENRQDCSVDVETPKNTTQPVKDTCQVVPNVHIQIPAIPVVSNSTEIPELPSKTDEPSEELIVSITSATQSHAVEGLQLKHNQLSLTAVLQTATLNSLSETVQRKIESNCSDVGKLVTEEGTKPVERNKEPDQRPSLENVENELEIDQPIPMATKDVENSLKIPENQGNNLENGNSCSKTAPVIKEAVDTYPTDNAFLKELEAFTLNKKSERWGLKPVISTCERLLIPFGSVDSDQLKSLLEKNRLAKNKHPLEKSIDALCEASNSLKNTQITADYQETIPTNGFNKETIPPNNEEHDKKSIENKEAHKSVSTTDENSIVEEHKEQHIMDVPIKEKSKCDSMLKKLKCVILKKRNSDVLRLGLNILDNMENDPISKRTKTTLENVKSSTDIFAKDSPMDCQILTSLPSVDPVFAQALGLTPKGIMDTNSAQKSDSSMEKELTLSKKYTPFKQHHSSPRVLGRRFKMLKKTQSISEEQVKKKWWLHFQTPTCYGEKLYEGCSRDMSVRKTVEEKSNTSSEALNLLADLALTANKEQVSPPAIQDSLQEFQSSLKKCENSKDVFNLEQQSVLHALPIQPASKCIQLRENPSPDSFDGSELIDVICQEHAYSLASSPSLLLALPAPFQVSPLNGSSRLLDYQRKWDGTQKMHNIFNSKETHESKQNDPEDPNKNWYRRKFCMLRSIVCKETSVQVTRHWEEEYDFNLDSQFTGDAKDKAIARALHGPWDISIHDTTEELQLIVHMWIGLFYSRSTARFFHLESDKTPEDVFDAVEASNEKEPMQKVTETVMSIPFTDKKNPGETVLSSCLANTAKEYEPNILDLCKPKYFDVDKEALNLSQKQVITKNSKQNPEQNKLTRALDSIRHGLSAVPPFQWYWNAVRPPGNPTLLEYVIPVNENHGNSSNLNHQVLIPVWGPVPNTLVNNNILIQTKNFPKVLELPKRKGSSSKKTQKHASSSHIPQRKESQENYMRHVQETLPNLKTPADLHSTNGNVDLNRSNNLLEIKNKYLEKLASINQYVDHPTSQQDKEGKNCHILKKLLQGNSSKQSSEFKIIPNQHTQIDVQSTVENSLKNESIIQSVVRHVFAFPKASATSVVMETSCSENRNEPQSLNFVGLPPFVQAEHEKFTSNIDTGSVSCVKEKEEPTLNQAIVQDIGIGRQNTSVEKTSDCNFSQDKDMKTIEGTFVHKTNVKNKCSNDNIESGYKSVLIPFIGMSTSIDECSLNENKENSVEDMEIDSSESLPSHIKVTTPSPSCVDNTTHNPPSNNISNSAVESETSSTFDIRHAETDDRCPTPTIDEQPYVYTSQSSLNYYGNDFKGLYHDGAKAKVQKQAEENSSPVLDEISVEAPPLHACFETNVKVDTQSDVEIRTLRTLQCLDEFLATLQNKSNPLFFNNKCSQNASFVANKNTSGIVYDFRDLEVPSSMNHSRSAEITQHINPLPSNDIIEDTLPPEETCPTTLLSTPDMLTEVLSKPIFSTEKSEQAVKCDNEKSLSNTVSHQCPEMTNMPITVSDTQLKPIKFCIKRTKQGNFVCSGSVFDAPLKSDNSDFAQPAQQNVDSLQCTELASSTLPSQLIHSEKKNNKYVTDLRDTTSIVKNKHTDDDIFKCITAFVDSKTNKIIDSSLGTASSLKCTVTNTKRKESSFLEKVSQRCKQDDSTQSSMDQECLIFVDKMKKLFKRKIQCIQDHCNQSSLSSSSPIVVQFSHLDEKDDVLDDIEIPISFFNQKFYVDMSDSKHLQDIEQQSSSKPLSHRELVQPAVSAITTEYAKRYENAMNKICSENRNASLLKDLRQTDSGDSDSCNYFDFCSQMKRELDDSFRNRLNSVVKKSCKTKNRFFLLVTSEDLFFHETRKHLEAEGHISVLPSEFFLRDSSSLPLMVIIRNEDIAEHIFEVPHLLQLRASQVVQFAGIDEPDDVVNLTYQEIFIKGGFVMFDKAAVESFSSGDMRRILDIFQKLLLTGKWKWVLHYRDSRRFKENARFCADAKEKRDLLNKCKEDGFVDILPYHECDLMSKEQPNYLQCLCNQQVQNISARYPVFVSDSETQGGFEKCGIVTMTVNSFLMESLCKIVNGS